MNKQLAIAFVFCCVCLTFLLTSCKDSPNAFIVKRYTNANELLPLSDGNYWVFSSWDYDRYYQRVHNTLATDSFVVNGKKTIEGLDASILQHFTNNVLKDTLFFCVTDTSILRYYYSIDSIHRLFTPRWLTIYKYGSENNTDYNLSDWGYRPFFDTIVHYYSQESSTSLLVFDTTIKLNNEKYSAQQMLQIHQYSESFWDTLQCGDTVGRAYVSFRKTDIINNYYCFYPGIGFMSIKQDPIWHSNYFNVGSYKWHKTWDVYTNGKIYSLLRYRVR